MAIISFDPHRVVDYIPEYNGNRESDNPCVVRLRFVPYARVQHYSRILAGRTSGVSDPLRITEITQEVQKRQFVENVEEILNYYVGEREVRDPEEFYETADTDLVVEIIKAMESHARLTEGQRKN